MKALVVNALRRGLDLEDIDIATPKGREVLVDVQGSGLCHTDPLFATHDIVPTLVSRQIAWRDVNDGYAALNDGSLDQLVVTSF